MKNALKIFILLVILMLATTVSVLAVDWPQFQANESRIGRTTDSVAPPYRARWIWLGPNKTLRNKASNAAWPDDLTSRDGYSYPMPATVDYTIAQSVQPVVAGGKVYVGTIEGGAYAINTNDGATVWSGSIPGGTISSAAVSGSIVIFGGVTGTVYGLNTSNGTQAWAYSCGGSITGAPCVSNGVVYVGCHDKYVYAINATSGALVWKSAKLGGPIQGGVAVSGTSVYAGAENMYVYALNTSDGAIRASHRVRGQSFSMLHPVVYNNYVFVQAAGAPLVGSEYVMESMMADSTSFSNEEANIARWLNGDINGGRWTDASIDWRHLFVLNTSDLTEPYTVLCGPVEGCGTPAEPPCVDNTGRVLTWWKTRYATLTKPGPIFGTNYTIDIAGINLTNGHRIQINNGQYTNMWPLETDNLFAMSVAGDYLWLRQNFRGTQCINLTTSSSRLVSATTRHKDGGNFGADVVYADQTTNETDAAQTEVAGRVAPVVAGNQVYITETFCVTAMEHY